MLYYNVKTLVALIVKSRLYRFCVLSAATLMTLSYSPLSHAQEKGNNPFQFGDWTLNCIATGVNKTSCVMNQTVLFKKTKRLYFKAALAKFEDKSFMTLEVPEAADLRVAPEMWFDDEKEHRKGAWAVCFKGICRAELELDSDSIEKMKKANVIKMQYQASLRVKPFVYQMSLKGFTKAYETLPIQKKVKQ